MVCAMEIITVLEWSSRNTMRSVSNEKTPSPSRVRDESDWIKLENTIFDALLPFKEAHAAVSRALAGLLNSS